MVGYNVNELHERGKHDWSLLHDLIELSITRILYSKAFQIEMATSNGQGQGLIEYVTYRITTDLTRCKDLSNKYNIKYT